MWVVVQLLVLGLAAGAVVPALEGAAGGSGGYLAMSFATLGLAQLLCLYVLRNFIRALPRELFDTAIVDGATGFQQLAHIVIPRLGAMVAVIGALLFVAFWNDSFLVGETLMSRNAVLEGVHLSPILFNQFFLGCVPALGVLVLLGLRRFARVFAIAVLQK